MSESGRMSLQELCERIKFDEHAEGRKRQRFDVTDALRTIYWYHGLRIQTQVQTPYGLGKRLEPEGYWHPAGGVPMNRNKWPSYAIGKHVPSKTLVARVGLAVPGSERDLNHPLWRALSKKPPTAAGFDTLMRQLGPESVRFMKRCLSARRRNLDGEGFDLKSLEQLEQDASLDSLAAIVLLLRRARLEGRQGDALNFGRFLLRHMVILGDELLARGIARPLLDLIDARILIESERRGVRYWLPPNFFCKIVDEMLDVMRYLQNVNYHALSSTQRRRRIQSVLRADCGLDLHFAFSPITHVREDAVDLDEVEAQSALVRMRTFLWAWNMRAKRIPHPEVPPNEVLTGEDLEAIGPAAQKREIAFRATALAKFRESVRPPARV